MALLLALGVCCVTLPGVCGVGRGGCSDRYVGKL